MDNETLQAISQMMDEKLKAEREYTRQVIQEELDPIKTDLEELKEGMKEVRESVASIVDWIDEAEHTVEIRFPVKKQQAQ